MRERARKIPDKKIPKVSLSDEVQEMSKAKKRKQLLVHWKSCEKHTKCIHQNIMDASLVETGQIWNKHTHVHKLKTTLHILMYKHIHLNIHTHNNINNEYENEKTFVLIKKYILFSLLNLVANMRYI